jgi:hypothetical protein
LPPPPCTRAVSLPVVVDIFISAARALSMFIPNHKW